MQTHKTLSIQKLNQAYIKLIKLVLTGSLSSQTSLINNFYTDPSPDEAYSLLNRILGQDNSAMNNNHKKKQDFGIDYNDSSGKKFQVRRAMTSGDQREFNNRIHEDMCEINMQQKGRGEKSSSLKKGVESGAGVGGEGGEGKGQKLKRITAKLTQIFSNNHKKIMKYEQISKNSGNMGVININQFKFAKPVETAFKKY